MKKQHTQRKTAKDNPLTLAWQAKLRTMQYRKRRDKAWAEVFDKLPEAERAARLVYAAAPHPKGEHLTAEELTALPIMDQVRIEKAKRRRAKRNRKAVSNERCKRLEELRQELARMRDLLMFYAGRTTA